MACDLIVTHEQWFKTIQEQLNKKFLIEKIVPIKNEMLGYLGQYFILKGRKENIANPSEFSFFLKIVPNGEKQKNFIRQSCVFNNEIVLYETLFPAMKFKNKPNFILGLMDNFILLEDMSENFQMQDKLKPFNLEFCKITLKTIAKFHSRSLIFEMKENKILNFLKNENINLHSPENLMAQAIKTNIEGVCGIIDFIADKSDKQWAKVKKILRKEAKEYYDEINFNGKKVLCHSDLWSNNILFQFDIYKNPIKCCLVDFQLCRYAPPAFDVLIFLYFTTEKKLRQKHFDELIDLYYDFLEKNLKQDGINIEKILPRVEFDESIKKLKIKAMTAVIAYMSIDFLTTNINKKGAVTKEEVWNCLSFDTKNLVLKQFNTVQEYKYRLKNNLEELFQAIVEEEFITDML